MRLRSGLAFGTPVAAFLLCGSSCFGQPVSDKQETINYAYGIGRITWTIPKDLEVIFAVPHWTAGPRIKCANTRYECEVEVGSRNISVSDDQRLSELEDRLKPAFQYASDRTFKPYRHGIDKSVVYTTLDDSRPSEPFRYYTAGYALRGPALIKFEAITNDTADTIAILNLVHSAAAVDALEMWAFRFGDYKAVCEDRFPMYRADNDNAFASSPFARVDLVRFFMQRRPSLSEEETRNELAAARQGYAKDFDGLPEAERRSFCEGLPRFIAEAAKDVQAK